MTERPHNARDNRSVDRTHNSRRHHEDRAGRHRQDETDRPGRHHRTEEDQHTSRVGRRHADD